MIKVAYCVPGLNVGCTWRALRTGVKRAGVAVGPNAPPSQLAASKDGGCDALVHPLYKDMSEYKVTLKWERGGAEFSYQKYPRDHTWSFDGGHTMTATAAPAYLGNPANVDPEEAFVASLSSCHMLTFLAIACKQKFVLDSYEDEAVGHMEKNADGKMAITRVELRPQIRWHGNRVPSAEELDKMHHSAHENCFIANSVKTDVTVAKP
jgi:organic hydroperoxide reductase OsmC/OhrA